MRRREGHPVIGSIGFTELLVILAVALLVIGPKKLPQLARNLGRGMREFRRAVSDVESSLELEEENLEEDAKAPDPEVEESRASESPAPAEGPAEPSAEGGEAEQPKAGAAASPETSPEGDEEGARPA